MLAILAAAAVLVSACAPQRAAPAVTPTRDLAGHWTYIPAGGGTSIAFDLNVTSDGNFTGTVSYGRGMGSTGDVSGQFSGGALIAGGDVRPRTGSAPGFKLGGSVEGGAVTLWRADAPTQKVQLTRQ